MPNPTLVDGTLEFAAVACGAAHTCAIDTEGDIYCWGDNDDGQLGNGGASGINSTPTLVILTGEHTWMQIASGGPDGNTTCAIDDTGELWCWGSNANGQGDPSSAMTVLVEPVRVFAP